MQARSCRQLEQALDRWCGGERDSSTLALL